MGKIPRLFVLKLKRIKGRSRQNRSLSSPKQVKPRASPPRKHPEYEFFFLLIVAVIVFASGFARRLGGNKKSNFPPLLCRWVARCGIKVPI